MGFLTRPGHVTVDQKWPRRTAVFELKGCRGWGTRGIGGERWTVKQQLLQHHRQLLGRLIAHHPPLLLCKDSFISQPLIVILNYFWIYLASTPSLIKRCDPLDLNPLLTSAKPVQPRDRNTKISCRCQTAAPRGPEGHWNILIGAHINGGQSTEVSWSFLREH